MTKRMIDVDAFLSWLRSQSHVDFIDDVAVDFIYLKYIHILDKIEELATPAPEPMEEENQFKGGQYD